ncbi:hypothetical protein WP1_130 [Pseudomonas phage WP1]
MRPGTGSVLTDKPYAWSSSSTAADTRSVDE